MLPATVPLDASSRSGRLVACCNPRSNFAAVNTVELAVDVEHIHLFDPSGGARIALQAGELGIMPNTGHEITTPIIDAMTAFLIRHSATT